MRKCGDFKISWSNPRSRKILNSTTSGREPMGAGGEERDILNVGCVKCGAW